MSWATVLKAGLKFMGRGAQATVKTVGHTALHPQQTIKGLGTATKTAAVGTAAGRMGETDHRQERGQNRR